MSTYFYFTPQSSEDIKTVIQKQAHKSHLIGHVRERADGLIEGLISGDNQDCQEYLTWLGKQSFCASLETKETTLSPNVDDFQILF